MCGIAGYYGQGNIGILRNMTETLRHRGPDNKGFFIDDNVGLGHARLSIIDLSETGRQPIANEDKTVWVAFNGEIYNFKNLKKTLIGRHFFSSHTDTEIIVHLYEEIGTEVFAKLEGMFAIALYDKSKCKLFLARDHMGKKPLYWGVFNKTLIFGSEVKAIIKHPNFRKELDFFSLNKYLAYEYIPAPHSIFKNLYKLEPAHYLEYDGKNFKKIKFWDIKFKDGVQKIKEENLLEELDKKIDQAVKRRLISDVPLGVFLSGGIDSSTIAYYAQKNSQQKIKTFSIGFKEGAFDESNYARQVAKYLGTEHYEKRLLPQDLFVLIPQIASILDEPMADTSLVSVYLLAQFTRKKVTVALGGDGGDELFCGYDTFVAHKLAGFYQGIPLAVRRNIIEKIALNLPTSFSNISFDFKAKRFVKGFYGEKKYRDHRWMAAFSREERRKLFVSDIWQNLKGQNELEDIDKYLSILNCQNYYQQLIYLYLRMYLMDDILVKVDRAGMANSLEVRAPFLDKNVVELVNNIPLTLKMKGFKTKYILKKLMKNKLPKEIIYRRKKGFGIPLAEWINKDLKSLVLTLLDKSRIDKAGLFNYNYIQELLNNHFTRRQDNRKQIWTLIVFEMWREKWFN